MTSVDYVVIALSPFLIMVLVGSLSFFLLELGYRGELTARLRWILFWFVIGTVGVARISMEEGSERASIYGLGLAGAVALAAWRLVDSPFLTWALMALIWWCAHKLTWDCTLIDDEQDASGEGLLQVAGLEEGIGESAAAATTNDEKPKRPSWWQRLLESPEERRKRPHAPGVWVIYFSLAALPLFGLGQALIPAGDLQRRQNAFWFLVWYVGSGMGLLLTTSFLGLRRYLRQRRLEMPASMTGVWLGVGGTLIVLLILVMMLVPRPNPEYPVEELIANAIRSPSQQASRYAVMRDSGTPQGPADAKPANPPENGSQTNGQQSEQKNPRSGQQQSGQQHSGQQQSGQQQGGQQQSGQQQSGQQQSGQQQGGQQQGGQQQGGQQQGGQQRSGQQQSGQQQSGQQQSGQQQSGQQQSGQQQNGQQSSSQQQSGQQQGGQQQSRQQQNGQQSRGQQQSGQQQSGQQQSGQQQSGQQQSGQQQSGQQQGGQQQSGQQKSEQQQKPPAATKQQGQQPQSDASQPETPSTPRPSRLPKLSDISLASWIRWLMWGVLAIGAFFAFLRYREQIVAFIRQLWAELLTMLGELFGRRKVLSADAAEAQPLEPPRPFAAFRNPFASGKADRLPPQELVRYTFEALDAWAFEHQAARRRDETPLEFADSVGDRHPALAQDSLQLARLYSQMVYARTDPTRDCLPTLQRLWDEMTRRTRQPAEACSS